MSLPSIRRMRATGRIATKNKVTTIIGVRNLPRTSPNRNQSLFGTANKWGEKNATPNNSAATISDHTRIESPRTIGQSPRTRKNIANVKPKLRSELTRGVSKLTCSGSDVARCGDNIIIRPSTQLRAKSDSEPASRPSGRSSSPYKPYQERRARATRRERRAGTTRPPAHPAIRHSRLRVVKLTVPIGWLSCGCLWDVPAFALGNGP